MNKPSSKPTGKANQFQLVEGFNRGYRNREDITTLPPGILVQGSQNVLTNTFQRIGIRKGYALDGQRTGGYNPILSSYEWEMHTGQEHKLRAGFDTSTNNGKLQYRYDNGSVTWNDLMTGLSSVRFNFCDYWDTTELKALLLFVNGSSNIYVWSGGVTTIASATGATITKNGTETWAEIGFLNTGTYTQQVTINGTVYTYTGGADTTTLTGVTPSPAAEAANSVATQTVVTVPNSAMTGIPVTFKNFDIANLKNQVYVTGIANQSIYVSKVNNFKNYSFSSPRLVGEGAILTLDGVPVAMVPEQDQMYISAAKDQWYQTKFALSADNKAESLTVNRLKTTAKQGTQSQAWTTKIKNTICYLSHEPILNSLGTSQDYLNDPQTEDLSYSIVNDMNEYDFTDGSNYYFKQFVYMAVPKESLIRIYNMTDQGSVDKNGNVIVNRYWEAPQTIPASRFYTVDGELYFHSYQSSDSFKLFTGYNDDGHTMKAEAAFSFENGGTRPALKNASHLYVEGYISSNTQITAVIQRDVGGSASTISKTISGNDPKIVPPASDAVSLGKTSLGKHPLGGSIEVSANTVLPKFRTIKTFNPKQFFEEQHRFSSLGIDQQWELIAYGSDMRLATEEPTFITE